jgi:hypothetical protein
MTSINMWSSGARECLLVVRSQAIELLLVENHDVIRRTTPTSAARALQLSDAWKRGFDWDHQMDGGCLQARSAA